MLLMCIYLLHVCFAVNVLVGFV